MTEDLSNFDFDKYVTKYIDQLTSGFLDLYDPMSYAMAIKILDNPESSKLDRQKALAFAEAYKKVVAYGIKGK